MDERERRVNLAKSFLKEATKILSGESPHGAAMEWHERVDYWKRCFDNLDREIKRPPPLQN